MKQATDAAKAPRMTKQEATEIYKALDHALSATLALRRIITSADSIAAIDPRVVNLFNALANIHQTAGNNGLKSECLSVSDA